MSNRLKRLSTGSVSLLLASLLISNLTAGNVLAASEAETAVPVADPAASSAGAQKAATCATCHGADGIAVLDLAPNLAGQKAMYTAIQLKAYRSGKRQHEVMSIIAKPLSDEDIDVLSEYYAGLGTQTSADTEAGPESENSENTEHCKPEVKS